MRDRVARLRLWLLGSAVFLILVIAAFIGSARYVRHRLKNALTSKLGVSVTNGDNGFHISRFNGSRTLFTLDAAKWEPVPNSNGVIVLHNATIVLYGKKGDRRDRIYGDEFEYDKDTSDKVVVRAKGLVHIDLQGVGPKMADGARSPAPQPENANGEPAGKVLHVTTSNLVYIEKLGVAATSDAIEFQSGGMTGHATGADYASDSGLLTLHSAVSMEGVAGGHPLKVMAATAEFDDHSQQTFLTGAKYESLGRTGAADQATLHSRPDGTLERVEAKGNVTGTANGATVVSQQADVQLNAAGAPTSALLTGGVKYAQGQPLRQVTAQSDKASIAFEGQKSPQPQHAVFTGSVHMIEKVRATEAPREPWSTRDLTAAKVDAVLVPAAKGQSQLQDAVATGNPRLTVVNNGSLANNKGAGTTVIAADDLKAHLIPASGGKQPPQLDTIAGRGHTSLHQVKADGSEQMSTGDSLDAKFRPSVATAKMAGSKPVEAVRLQATDILLSAVQQGHITMMQRKPARAGVATGAGAHEEVQHATAQQAAYDGDQDRVTLTGGVQLTDNAGSLLLASQVSLDNKTGDSQATGGVKVDYVDTSNQHGASAVSKAEPTHFLADRAEFQHAADVATFHGKPVRMWQEGNQVQAPVIELARGQKRMIARGEVAAGDPGTAETAQVHAVLTSGGGEAAAGTAPAGAAKTGCANSVAKAGTTAGAQAANVVRIASGGLAFSGVTNRADFTGGFRADTTDGTIRADAGTAYLQPRAPGNAGAASTPAGVPSLSGTLDHVVATGSVDIRDPGLRATGARLVCTENDQICVLTGDPRATTANGITTGAALRLHRSCDDIGGVSVDVLGAAPGEPSQRVETQTRVGQDEMKGKGKAQAVPGQH